MEQSETAEKLVKLLKKKNLTVTTAESCTGGMIASAIVSVAGASACFKEGYITYSNEAKKKLLGVREDTLKQYTVVSAQVAQEMAAGAAAGSPAWEAKARAASVEARSTSALRSVKSSTAKGP